MKKKSLLNSEEFFKAAENGDVEKVTALLEAGVDPDLKGEYDKTALYHASKKGYLEIVELLLEKGANVNAQDNDLFHTVLHRASRAGHLKVVNLLLDKGANINEYNIFGETVLHLATVEGYLEVVKLLFERGADVNALCDMDLLYGSEIWDFICKSKDKASSECRVTALHLAIWKSHLEMVKLFLTKEENINFKNKSGETALHWASYTGENLDVIKLLLEKGANVNDQDEDGEVALHWASRNNTRAEHLSLEVIRYLLEEEANVNIQDKSGNTPLHTSVNCSRLDCDLKIPKFLVKKGANIEAKNNKAETPFDIAKKRFNESFLGFLKSPQEQK